MAKHFFDNYSQVEYLFIKVLEHPWERLVQKDGTPHKYTHVRGGPETRFTELRQTRGRAAELVAGFEGLEVLKTCGSKFAGFHRCKHTTLPEAHDRLLSTSITCRYKFGAANAAAVDYERVYALVRATVIEYFADFVSESVQQLLYKVGVVTLQREPALADIWYQLPNIHFYDYKLPELGYPTNDTMIVFTDPNGLIEGRVSRKNVSAKL